MDKLPIFGMLVQRDLGCDDCISEYIHRDILIYNSNLELVCNIGWYAEDGTFEKVCPNHDKDKVFFNYINRLLLSALIENGIHNGYEDLLYGFGCFYCDRDLKITVLHKEPADNEEDPKNWREVCRVIFKEINPLITCYECTSVIKPAN